MQSTHMESALAAFQDGITRLDNEIQRLESLKANLVKLHNDAAGTAATTVQVHQGNTARPKTTRSTLSPQGRRRIAEAQRRRHAEAKQKNGAPMTQAA